MKTLENPEKKLEGVITGFDALLAEVERLQATNRSLQQQLSSGTEKQPSTPAATEDGKECPRNHKSSEQASLVTDRPPVQHAKEIVSEWRTSRRPAPSKIELPPQHPPVDIEQDFTTPGRTPGRLGCPFAAMQAAKEKGSETSELKMGRKGRRPGQRSQTTSGSHDPIAAEFHSHSNNSSKSYTSANAGSAQCPIRFLDQHKPEEVAQYFEKHKHEIPRSHEICIKRYQTNEESVRKLDAKYGSLVNMIQGLGKKHQPMLEEKIDEEDEDEDGEMGEEQAMSDKDIVKIQKWAGNVGDEPAADPPVEQQLNDIEGSKSEREPRFERELREVRLGESPSRPWGIRIPAHAQEQMDSAAVSIRATEENAKKPEIPEMLQSTKKQAQAALPRAEAAPMIFNGPVFFGYSADDVARLLQQFPELQKTAR